MTSLKKDNLPDQTSPKPIESGALVVQPREPPGAPRWPFFIGGLIFLAGVLYLLFSDSKDAKDIFITALVISGTFALAGGIGAFFSGVDRRRFRRWRDATASHGLQFFPESNSTSSTFALLKLNNAYIGPTRFPIDFPAIFENYCSDDFTQRISAAGFSALNKGTVRYHAAGTIDESRVFLASCYVGGSGKKKSDGAHSFTFCVFELPGLPSFELSPQGALGRLVNKMIKKGITFEDDRFTKDFWVVGDDEAATLDLFKKPVIDWFTSHRKALSAVEVRGNYLLVKYKHNEDKPQQQLDMTLEMVRLFKSVHSSAERA